MIRRLGVVLFIAAFGTLAAAESFRVEAIAERIFLLSPVDPGEHRLERVNALVVDLGDGLLVAETQPSVAAAREMLAAIEARWPQRPLRYVVVPYPTAASSGGAAAFPDSTLVVASHQLLAAWDDPDYDRGAELRFLADDPESYRPPPTRRPDLIVHGRFQIHGSEGIVVLDIAQAGYSKGGLVAYVPHAELYYAGALIDGDRAAPLPLVGDTGKWTSMLNQLVLRDGEIYVGRQGPPLDNLGLRRYRDGFAWIRGQVEHAFVKHQPIDELPARIAGDPGLAERFALDKSPDGARSLIDKTIDEVLTFRRQRGIPDPDQTTRKSSGD